MSLLSWDLALAKQRALILKPMKMIPHSFNGPHKRDLEAIQMLLKVNCYFIYFRRHIRDSSMDRIHTDGGQSVGVRRTMNIV